MRDITIDHDDELSELDQSIVGTVCRIEIPMRSPSALLQVADLLRGLANQCEFTATNKDADVRLRMLGLMMYARSVNKRMKKLKGRGRPARSLTRYSGTLDNG
jgi:predicted transcriptional regulator